MVDVVRRLAADCTLAVMSSNAMQVLRRVLVAGDLAFCFAHVFGGDVMPDKRAAIRAFLADTGSGFGRRCSADYDETGRRTDPDPSTTVLVTDTAGDVRDALEAGIRVVGVAWGMHSVDELKAAGAEFVALWPQEVAAHLLGDAAADPVTGACALPPRAPAGSACGVPRSVGVGDEIAAAGGVRRERRRLAVVREGSAEPHRGVGAPEEERTAAAGWAKPNEVDAELMSALNRIVGVG
jgi:phosphoglycolate phosphatase